MRFTQIVKEMTDEEFQEGGWSRTANTLRGMSKRIMTLGILTAEDPCIKPKDFVSDKEQNKKLETELQENNIGYRKVKGRYSIEENSFMVFNITKEEIIILGNKYGQESVIYGYRTEDKSKFGMSFEMIITNICNLDNDGIDSSKEQIGNVVGTAHKFVTKGQNTLNNYSKIQGRKFQIPFFDDPDSDWYPDYNEPNGNISEENNEKMMYWIKRSIQENVSPKVRWISRGVIKNYLHNRIPTGKK